MGSDVLFGSLSIWLFVAVAAVVHADMHKSMRTVQIPREMSLTLEDFLRRYSRPSLPVVLHQSAVSAYREKIVNHTVSTGSLAISPLDKGVSQGSLRFTSAHS